MTLTAADKSLLLAQLAARLEAELASLSLSARTAHEAATHAESRPENKYDTRGLEAAYLAGAQKERAAELQGMLTAVRAMVPRTFTAGDKVATGALVELMLADQTSYVLLVPAGAGYRLETAAGAAVTVTGQAPLGKGLLGKRVGETVTVRDKEYEIASIV